LAELRALAHAADCPVTVLTPVNAGAYAGPAYYLEILRLAGEGAADVRFLGVLDCGDDAAIAVAALEMGWWGVVLRGNARARARVTDIANRNGGRVFTRRPAAVELSGRVDLEGFCRSFFAA
jgi:hypothetical protein